MGVLMSECHDRRNPIPFFSSKKRCQYYIGEKVRPESYKFDRFSMSYLISFILFVLSIGWSLGEHQEWSKYSNFEVSTRAPLMLHVPGMTHPTRGPGDTFPYIDVLQTGVTSQERVPNNKTTQSIHSANSKSATHDSTDHLVSDGSGVQNSNQSFITYNSAEGFVSSAFVELVDIFPTLAELSGIPVPPLCPTDSLSVDFCTEGRSFAPLLHHAVQGRDVKWKNAAFSQYPRPSVEPQEDSDKPRLRNINIMGYSMRTDMYRYTEWIGFDPKKFQGNWSDVYARELYLHRKDPSEDFNVAENPKYKGLVDALSLELQGGWRNSFPDREVAAYSRAGIKHLSMHVFVLVIIMLWFF